MKQWLVGLTAWMLVSSAFVAHSSTIRVAAQDVNETIVLAHMAALLIEAHTDLNATVNESFTGASVLHQAMVGNAIDVYPSWTGTQLTGILRYEGENLPSEETFRMVSEGFREQFNMFWSEPLGFNNTYTFVVRPETAEEFSLRVASDLAAVAGDMTLAGDSNFDIRPDAYPGWSEHYGISFDRLVTMQYGLLYRAIGQGEVDAAVAYSTDSRIATLGLVMLEDDKEFFPDYSGAFIVRGETVENFPEVLEVLNRLGGMIDDSTMSALNGRFDAGEEPSDIARDFLQDVGLLN